MILEIRIPDIHPSLNEWTRFHWAVKKRIKDTWYAQIYVLVYQLKSKQCLCLPFKSRPKVTITYRFPDNRDRDADNYAPKFIIDGLRYARVISNDSVKDIQLEPVKIELGTGTRETIIRVEDL